MPNLRVGVSAQFLSFSGNLESLGTKELEAAEALNLVNSLPTIVILSITVVRFMAEKKGDNVRTRGRTRCIVNNLCPPKVLNADRFAMNLRPGQPITL